MDTFEKVREMMVEDLDLEKDDIKLNSTFESLDIDSLDTVELISNVEDEFEIEFETFDGLENMEDLINAIDEMKS